MKIPKIIENLIALLIAPNEPPKPAKALPFNIERRKLEIAQAVFNARKRKNDYAAWV